MDKISLFQKIVKAIVGPSMEVSGRVLRTCLLRDQSWPMGCPGLLPMRHAEKQGEP